MIKLKIIHLSNEDIRNLNRLIIDVNILNTESNLFLYQYRNKQYVLKEMFPEEKNKFDNKMRTLLSVDSNTDIIPAFFIKPKFLVSSDYSIKYWSSDFINGFNLNSVLNDNRLSLEIKKKYLKRVGLILKQMDYIRKNTYLNDFYIGDLNENNFIVDRNDKILVCDVDSIKIDGNKSSVSKYLSPFSLLNKSGVQKYKIDNTEGRIGDFVIDKNTDLYCYVIIVLNFLYGGNINNISIDDFYRFLSYLDDIKVDNYLIEIFNRIILEEDNVNPCYYIDSLTDNQIVKARCRKI